jgi:DUF1680 family protein
MRTFLCLALCAASVLAGELSERLQLTKTRVLEGSAPRFDERFILADASAQPGRRFTEFSGDVSGRYIGALSALASYSGERYAVLDRVVDGAIRVQQPDGHFGAALSSGPVVDSDMATLWGNGRMLIGLLEYYALTHRAEALGAARKLGDFLVAAAPRFNSAQVREAYNGEKFAVGYICWTNALEGVVELYRVTKDERYLALARSIAERTDRHPAQHSHGFLTTVRGVVALYRVTGEASYLEQAETLWAGVIESGNVLIQGAVPEMFAPRAKRDEGCSEADWLRLSLDLWEVTRKARYLEQAELTLFNEMAMNQFHTGDYGHHMLTEEGIAGPFAHAWWCCTFHGLRALVATFQRVFHSQAGALFYDLPVDGRGEAEGLAMRAESELERTATVRLSVVRADRRAHALRIRRPEWATAVQLALGGRPLEAQTEGGYLTAARVWQSGEVVTVRYAMRTREVKRGGNGAADARQAAVFYGPWLLAVDPSASPNFFDEPANENQVELVEQNGQLRLGAAPQVAEPASRFAVPVAHFVLHYRPGGYPMQPQTALLRPISEYTHGPDANELWFWLPLVPRTEGLDSNYK